MTIWTQHLLNLLDIKIHAIKQQIPKIEYYNIFFVQYRSEFENEQRTKIAHTIQTLKFMSKTTTQHIIFFFFLKFCEQFPHTKRKEKNPIISHHSKCIDHFSG